MNADALIRTAADGTLSFGDYTLQEKAKVSDFPHKGDLYKVKSFYEITKLEKNGLFVYESVPGTKVTEFTADDKKISFVVEGKESTAITLELEEEKEFGVICDGRDLGKMKTNLGGKLTLSVDLEEGSPVAIEVVKY